MAKVKLKEGHHHNGDQVTRQLHILCSICVHPSGDLAKAVRLFTASLHSQLMYTLFAFSSISDRLGETSKDFSTPGSIGKGEVGVGAGLI